MGSYLSVKTKQIIIFLCLLINLSSLRFTHANGSWDSYLENLVAQSTDSNGIPHCDKAAIVSLDGGSFWNSRNAPNSLQITRAEA